MVEDAPDHRLMVGANLPTGDVTFVFTDVEGSTSLLRELGDEVYARVIADVTRVQSSLADAHGGVLVSIEGDGAFLAFGSPDGAVGFAESVQHELVSRERGSGVPVRIRVGMHRGRGVAVANDNYATLAAHQAARIANAAHGGQVLLTSSIADGSPRPLEDLGVYLVRDFDEPVNLFALHIGGAQVRRPRLPHAVPVGMASFPVFRTSFIGREEQRRELRKALQANRLITVLGPGGAGKTRLSVEVLLGAEGFVLQWFVDLTTASDDDGVTAAIRTALDDYEGVVDLNDPVDALSRILVNRPGLLLIDNCEHVLDAAAACIDRLLTACPKLGVVSTSRQPLALPDEWILPLHGLEVPDDGSTDAVAQSAAARLFLERAQRVTEIRPEDHLHVGNLVRALDGLPLALELVASQLHHRSVQEVATLIAEQLGPAAPSARGRPQRHMSLRAVLDWSVGQLDESQRRALAALSCPVPPFTAPIALAAVAGAGLQGPAATRALEVLVDRSLVVTQGAPAAAYRLLETVRAYAERLPELTGRRENVAQSIANACLDALGVPVIINAMHGRLPHDLVTPTAAALLHSESLPSTQRQRLAVALGPWLWGQSPQRVIDVLTEALEWDTQNDTTLTLLHRGLMLAWAEVGDFRRAESHLDLAAHHLAASGNEDLAGSHHLAGASFDAYCGRFGDVRDAALTALNDVSLAPELRHHWLSHLAVAELELGEDAFDRLYEALEAAHGPDRLMALMNLANHQGIVGDLEAAVRNALEVFTIGDTTMKLMMADIIAHALWQSDPTQENLTLFLATNHAYASRGFRLGAIDQAKVTGVIAQARDAMPEGRVQAAQDLAKTLDTPDVLEAVERLGRQLLVALEGLDL